MSMCVWLFHLHLYDVWSKIHEKIVIITYMFFIFPVLLSRIHICEKCSLHLLRNENAVFAITLATASKKVGGEGAERQVCLYVRRECVCVPVKWNSQCSHAICRRVNSLVVARNNLHLREEADLFIRISEFVYMVK